MRITRFLAAGTLLLAVTGAAAADDSKLNSGRTTPTVDRAGNPIPPDQLAFNAIQLMLERYSVDHSYYPQHLNQMVVEDYLLPGLRQLPDYRPQGIDDTPRRSVPYGWSAGDLTYLQHYGDDAQVDGYVLICYGPDRDGGLDVDGDGTPDGVLSVLKGGAMIRLVAMDGTDAAIPVPLREQQFIDAGQFISFPQSEL